MSDTKARLKLDDLYKFDWERTDKDQGNFDIKMMTFLWFDQKVAPYQRKRVQLISNKQLASVPIRIKEADVRATLELDPEERPWNKAQAIFVCKMREHANHPRDTFDIKWVNKGLCVSVSMPAILPVCHCRYSRRLRRLRQAEPGCWTWTDSRFSLREWTWKRCKHFGVMCDVERRTPRPRGSRPRGSFPPSI